MGTSPINSLKELITSLPGNFNIDAGILLRLYYLAEQKKINFSDKRQVYDFARLIEGVVCKNEDEQIAYEQFLKGIEPPPKPPEPTEPPEQPVQPPLATWKKISGAFISGVILVLIFLFFYNKNYCGHPQKFASKINCYCRFHVDSLQASIIDTVYDAVSIDSGHVLKARTIHPQVRNRWELKDSEKTVLITGDSVVIPKIQKSDLQVALFCQSGTKTDSAYKYFPETVFCKADFNYNPVKSFDDSVIFTNSSFGDSLEYDWYFDDGTHSNVKNQVHFFKVKKDTFRVSLVARNKEHSDSIARPVSVFSEEPQIPTMNIPAPEAIDIDISQYKILITHFSDQSVAWRIFLCMVILTGLFVFLYYFDKRFISIRKQKKLPPLEGPYYKHVSYDVKQTLYDNDEIQNIIKSWREKKQTNESKIDIDTTIHETINHAGLLQIHHFPAYQIPEYLLLIKADSKRNHHYQLIRNLFDTINKFISIDAYLYENDIGNLTSLSGKKFSLKDLHVTHADNRLIVWSDGHELIDKEKYSISKDLQSDLSVWNERSLFTPVQPELWNENELLLSELFILERAGANGMIELMEDLQTIDFYSIKNKVGELTDKLNSLSDFPNIEPYLVKMASANGDKETERKFAEGYITRLSWYFESDPRIFQLIACCALHEYLYWDLTRQLAIDLYAGENLLTDELIVQLNYLPWFREGSIPKIFREVLMEAIDENKKAIALNTVKKVITYNLEQKEILGPDDVISYADFNLNVNLAALEKNVSGEIREANLDKYKDFIPPEPGSSIEKISEKKEAGPLSKNVSEEKPGEPGDAKENNEEVSKVEVLPLVIEKIKIRVEKKLEILNTEDRKDTESKRELYKLMLFIIKKDWRIPFYVLFFSASILVLINPSYFKSGNIKYKGIEYVIDDSTKNARYYSKMAYDTSMAYDSTKVRRNSVAYNLWLKSDSLEKNDTTLHNLNYLIDKIPQASRAQKNFNLYIKDSSRSVVGCNARLYAAVRIINDLLDTVVDKKSGIRFPQVNYPECLQIARKLNNNDSLEARTNLAELALAAAREDFKAIVDSIKLVNILNISGRQKWENRLRKYLGGSTVQNGEYLFSYYLIQSALNSYDITKRETQGFTALHDSAYRFAVSLFLSDSTYFRSFYGDSKKFGEYVVNHFPGRMKDTLGLLFKNNLPSDSGNVIGEDILLIDGIPCPMGGSAIAGTVAYNENLYKNRYKFPPSTRLVTFNFLIGNGTDDRTKFNADEAITTTGYVSSVKVGGVETCNCGSNKSYYKDTQIELVADLKDDVPAKRLIVEVTPRMRIMFAKQGIDWTTENLKRMLTGQKVRVSGWLFFDSNHFAESANGNKNSNSNRPIWRATSWEIHPVTRIKIMESELDTIPNCNVVFTSLITALINPDSVCNLNLSKILITKDFSLLSKFKNLKNLDITYNNLTKGQIDTIKYIVGTKCKVISEPQSDVVKDSVKTAFHVDLISFSAVISGDKAKLAWESSSEENSREFIVERTTDSKNFTEIARVKAAGKSTSLRSYTAYDDSPLEENNYYRLKQMDINGEFLYSQLIVAKFLSFNILDTLKLIDIQLAKMEENVSRFLSFKEDVSYIPEPYKSKEDFYNEYYNRLQKMKQNIEFGIQQIQQIQSNKERKELFRRKDRIDKLMKKVYLRPKE